MTEAEERKSELEERTAGVIGAERNTGKRSKEVGAASETSGTTFKCSDIRIIGAPAGEDKRKGH